MTPKQERFIAEYRKDLNATQAAIRAGYPKNRARQTGHELVTKSDIAEALAVQAKDALEEVQVDARRALREAAALAFSDLGAFYDENGDIKPMKDWTPAMRASVQSLETLDRDITPGERGPAAKVHRLKLWDKPKNLEMLFKHLGLLAEKVNVDGKITVEWLK